MPMNADGRTQALYAAVQSANPKVNQMTQGEQSAMQASLKAIFGQADLNYIVANATVVPSTLTAPSTNCTVATSTGPASGTTIAATIAGQGKLT